MQKKSVIRLLFVVLATGGVMVIGGVVAGSPAFAFLAVIVAAWASAVLLFSWLEATTKLDRRGAALARFSLAVGILVVGVLIFGVSRL